MQDLVNALAKIIPTCTNEGQYLHPCFEHIDQAAKLRGEKPFWSLNTDAHLRSVLMGRSVQIPIIDGEMQLGEFGMIWFGDWDQVRARLRTAIVPSATNFPSKETCARMISAPRQPSQVKSKVTLSSSRRGVILTPAR